MDFLKEFSASADIHRNYFLEGTMTDDKRKAEGLKRLVSALGDDEVTGLVFESIRAIEREAWMQGFEFGIEMDKAILEIGKVIDP